MGDALRLSAADAVLLVHGLYVAFVATGFVLIPLGVFRGWRFVRSWRYRLLHALAIAVVVFEQGVGMACPLTVWEARLRGVQGAPRAFVPALVQGLVFHAWPPWVFTLLYAVLLLLVFLYALLWPPTHR